MSLCIELVSHQELVSVLKRALEKPFLALYMQFLKVTVPETKIRSGESFCTFTNLNDSMLINM